MITTAESQHGPEIAYLEDGVNGLVVRGGAAEYAAAVVAMLSDGDRYAALRQAALQSAGRYTLNNMVARFCDGIERCLRMDRKR
jgi:glycosyltransferase involved in cell wall biosynthesis